MNGYREGLRRAVGGAAVPYGYTAVTWTSGGVLIHTHGAPGAGAAALFLAGTATSFGVAAALAGGAAGSGDPPADPRRVGLVSAVAAAAGLGCAALLAPAVTGKVAYLLVGFAAAAYLLVGAAGLALAVHHDGRVR